MSVIDSLTHITANGQWFQTPHEASLSRLLLHMETHGIDQSIVTGLPLEKNNDVVLAATQQHQGRLIPIAAVRPQYDAEHVLEQMRQLKAQGFVGIKVHPRLCGEPLTSSWVTMVLNSAAQLNLPVFLCTVHKHPLTALEKPLTDAIYTLCQLHQNTKIILLHGGYTEILAVSEAVRPFKNVLLDLSATLTRFYDASIGQDIRFLLRTFDQRLCLGSDFPENTFDEVKQALAFLDIPFEHLQETGILGSNLATFLGLPVYESAR